MTTPAIGVLGAGSWGTALAVLLARNGSPTRLWARDPGAVERLRAERENARYLPGTALPDALTVTGDLDEALRDVESVLVAVPCEGFRSVLRAAAPHLAPRHPVAWATKGLESGTQKLLHEVAREELGPDRALAALSGPTFAREVARGLPTAVSLASDAPSFAETLAARLHGGSFRVYTSSDLVGVELGGAVKNVLAIAAGAADGIGFGANTRAALITRGLAEMMRLGEALGGRRETLMGLAGLGDLVLTCTDDQSRNRQVGLRLARGESLTQAIAAIGQAVEGVHTAPEVVGLARRARVEIPICDQTYRVLYENVEVREAVEALLGREQKSET